MKHNKVQGPQAQLAAVNKRNLHISDPAFAFQAALIMGNMNNKFKHNYIFNRSKFCE